MNNFEILTFPKSRRATFDVGKIGSKKHHVVALLEIDVTDAKKRVKESIEAGKKVSFTSWFVKTIGDTIADHKYSHAINYKQERQIAFDAVDIAMPIEREVDGIKVPLATIIRDTNTKTIEEINHEIKNAVSRKIKSEGDYVLTERKNKKLTGLFFHFPQWMRMIIWQKILKNPFSIKENMGTVMITNVGMVGRHSGWIIPKSLHNLSFGIGAVTKKPWVVKDKIEIREILHLTILFDHDVMDGAPAARFTDCLIRNLENAKEL